MIRQLTPLVVEALGNIGPAALPAVPYLRAAWNNNQSALGQLVAAALTRIEGPAKE